MTDGNPNTPLPMMQLTVSAARLQRLMARTSAGWLGSGIAGLYHETGQGETVAVRSDLAVIGDRWSLPLDLQAQTRTAARLHPWLRIPRPMDEDDLHHRTPATGDQDSAGRG